MRWRKPNGTRCCKVKPSTSHLISRHPSNPAFAIVARSVPTNRVIVGKVNWANDDTEPTRHDQGRRIHLLPRAKFKPVNTANIARVFVAILAMERHSPITYTRFFERFAARRPMTSALREDFAQYAFIEQSNANTNYPAYLFDVILGLSKEEREAFVQQFNEFLDELVQEDFFGTEGQHDPRGSHRD